MKVKDICKSAIVAAIYVALTLVNPMSFGAVQLRVSNLLCVIPFVNKKYVPGILIGIAIANATSPLGPLDVVFGVAAEGIAYALCVYGPLKAISKWVKTVILSICVAVVIGAELTLLSGAPFAATALCVLVGTEIVAAIGTVLISKPALKKIL